MNNKDRLEITKRFKKEENTFTKVSGCYVNSDKQAQLKFTETFHKLSDEELFKYLEIAKKALSGKIGNNLLELNFTEEDNEKQKLLMMINRTGLKEDGVLSIFYDAVIESYDYSGNYLILLFHDIYDVMTKTSDNRKLDESEEVYEYIICAICPVKLSKPGLGYFNKENQIKPRIRDWVVDTPAIGFTYPAFTDRSSDVDTIMYYTKNTKEAQENFMSEALGCLPKQTATKQQKTFETIVKTTVSHDKKASEKLFEDIQENLHTMIEEHNAIYEDTDHEPMTLSKEKVKDLLIDSGVSEEITVSIEKDFEREFGDKPPLAECLVDEKLVKKNAQKKKEEKLLTQIKELENKLESVDNGEIESLENSEEMLEEAIKEYDVVLQVKPEKLDSVKTEIINGKRCIVIPFDDDEEATINGINTPL